MLRIRAAATAFRLVWLDRQGREIGVLDDACFCTHPVLSPDGRRTVVSVTDATTGNADIRIYENDRTRLPLTFDPAPEGHPSWNADGSRVIFTSLRTGFTDNYWEALDGSGSTEPLLRSDRDKYVHSVSDYGVVFTQDGDLWLLPLTDPPTLRALTSSTDNGLFGHVSPNGRWLLYQSDEGGTPRVYVTSFPALTGRWLVSEGAGLLPRWSRDGREIYYLNRDHSTLFAAAVAGEGSTFRVLGVQRLFSAPLVVGRGHPYDVSPDGRRFVVVTSRGAAATPLTLVVDWPSQVRR